MPSRFGFSKLREPSEAGQHRSVRDLEKECVKDAPGREHRGSASKAPRVLERIAAVGMVHEEIDVVQAGLFMALFGS